MITPAQSKGCVHIPCANSPRQNIPKPLSDHEKEASQRLIFNGICSILQTNQFKNLNSIDVAIAFNTHRLKSDRIDQQTKVRLSERSTHLTAIKERFTHQDNREKLQFIGLIGWGNGCLNTRLSPGQNVGALDGFVYIDAKGEVHYQRAGSCLELFLDKMSTHSPRNVTDVHQTTSKPIEKSMVLTKHGLDINLNTSTCTLCTDTCPNSTDDSKLLSYHFSNDIIKTSIDPIKIYIRNYPLIIGNSEPIFGGVGFPKQTEQLCPRPMEITANVETTPTENGSNTGTEFIDPFGGTILSLFQTKTEGKKKIRKTKRLSPRPMEITANVETTPTKHCSNTGTEFEQLFGALDFPTHQNPTTNPDSKKCRSHVKRTKEPTDTSILQPKLNDEQVKRIKETTGIDPKDVSSILTSALNTRPLKRPPVRYFSCIFNIFKKDSSDNHDLDDILRKTLSDQSLSDEQKINRLKGYLSGDDVEKIMTNVNKFVADKHISNEHKALILLIFLAQGKFSEGCPCCGQALDLDELVAFSKIDSADNTRLYDIANDGPTMPAELGLPIAGLALLGLTASLRNINGARATQAMVKELKTKIQYSIALIKLTTPDWEKNTELKNKLISLKAHLITLDVSLTDAKFNMWIPGVLNGIASLSVGLSPLIKTPFGLLPMAMYGLSQSARNAWDLKRVWSQSIPKPTPSNAALLPDQNVTHGVQKINQFGKTKRTFYGFNGFNFACLGVGGLLAFCSLPALGLGVGAATLPIGIALFAYGAGSTAIGNNLWPKKFSPKNGDLGCDRASLNSDTCLSTIGKKRQLKTILKKHVTTDCKDTQTTRIACLGIQLLKALPNPSIPKCISCIPQKMAPHVPERLKKVGTQLFNACPKLPRLPTGIENGINMEHAMKKRQFEKSRGSISNARRSVLDELLDVSMSTEERQQFNATHKPPSANSTDFEQLQYEWALCNALGIHHHIAQLLITSEKTHRSPQSSSGKDCTDSCCSGTSLVQWTKDLSELNIFNIETGGLKNDLSQDQIDTVREKIEWFLYFEWIEILRYEERGLIDFYWARKRVEAMNLGDL